MKDLILVMSMQLLNLSSFAVYSILGLTYTLQAAKKGSSTTVSGLVFAAYPYIVSISSLFIGKYLPKLGPTLVRIIFWIVPRRSESNHVWFCVIN